jgi:subtilisin-like proprotein convertase family protein
VGIGPTPVIAVDNTLGSFSPYQGRIYVAYTALGNNDPKVLGAPDNSDVLLAHSDDGGQTWSAPVVVNDDSQVDGFSEGNRPQFLPAIAVDQTTGALVVTFYDARQDAARARVARYLAVSIDGGSTFAPETFANPAQTALDAITGATDVLGPIPDNESPGNSLTDKTDGFGNAEAVLFNAGHIVPIWAGNQLIDAMGVAHLNEGTLGIRSAEATVAAGPRVIASSMGPVQSETVDGTTFNNVFTVDGIREVTGFTVTFDRPVDPATFTVGQVTVIYRNTTTPADEPGTPVAVASVVPLDSGPFGPAGVGGLATTFLVSFVNPQSGTGTYSYSVGPLISDKIRSQGLDIVPNGTTATFSSGNVNIPIPDVGTATAPLTINGIPSTTVVQSLTVTVNINHTFDGDLSITLIAPSGTQVPLYSPGDFNFFSPTTANFTNTVFDDNAALPISAGDPPYTGSFRPDSPLSVLKGLNLNGTWQLQVTDNFPVDVGTILNFSLNITEGTLVAGSIPGNLMDQNANATTGETPGDIYANPRPLNGVPFDAPYDSTTLPIIVPGPHVVSTSVPGQPATTDNLVLNNTVSAIDVTFDRDMQASTFTPAEILRMFGPAGQVLGPFTITPNPNNTDPDPNFPRTFRIGFPSQELSGTYTIQFGPGIAAKNGDLMDTNLNAGLDVLRNQTVPGGPTSPVIANSPNVPLTILPGKTVISTLNVTDNFSISSLTLGLNIAYPNDPDLTAQLVAPDGTTINLFSNVGNVGTRANFTNTVFDDNATTPIQAVGVPPPFSGSFNPQTPLSVLDNKASGGIYSLVIHNSSTTNVGVLNSWNITFQKPVPGTDLGEPVADQAMATFRIFTFNQSNPLAHNVWTAVGPASIGEGGGGPAGGAKDAGSREPSLDPSGRITGLAIDPSDPSGNTMYVAGASGGLWKTTDFLTSSAAGPTYQPLTDFGPSFGINVGGIAVIGRNNDTTQSMLFLATGEGDTATSGAGILRSEDGGVHWTDLDSTTNVDGSGNPLPINDPGRDHVFVGASSFKIIGDPKLSPSGQAIVYVATTKGIYGTQDSGAHWTQLLKGDATDVAFANDSADPTTGNLDVLFGAIAGTGVFMSSNQGMSWLSMTGGVGDPLIQDVFGNALPINSANLTVNPNGANGRITLVTPALTGNPLQDKIYEGWVYAVVVTTGGNLSGLYLTKDFGQNWVKIKIPVLTPPLQNGQTEPTLAIPSNNESLPNADPLGSKMFAQGNYDVSLAIDPTNPNVVYLGGTNDGQPLPQGGLLRVDTTGVSDAHALVADDYDNSDGGMTGSGVGGITNTPLGANMVNLIRNPSDPFVTGATIVIPGVLGTGMTPATFQNDGGDITTWLPFNDVLGGSTDQHRVVFMKDPLTGKPRIIFGDDQGVFTGIDQGNGQLLLSVGNTADLGSASGEVQIVTGSRNGNLQVTQFYYGAAQPSNAAAQIAGALFYGSAQDNGIPQSDPNLLSNGNISWGGPGGDSAAVITDPTGSGSVYHYNWPCCDGLGGGVTTNFFEVTTPAGGTVGRTFGLLQQSLPGPTPDPQWPFTGGFRFAVNPYVPAFDSTTGLPTQEIVISSATGNIFRTNDQGVLWFQIGVGKNAPLDGSNANALAFGAPDPSQNGAQDNYILAGTLLGHMLVTFDGGGTWTDISKGLDGSTVQYIVTNPVKGSHEAFAVTSAGVYHIADTSAAGASWTNVTSNLFQLTHTLFGSTNQVDTLARNLTSLAVDWRPALSAVNSGTSPILYVGGEAGVFRSKDGGSSWTIFPDVADDGSIVDGGFLPNAKITHLDLVIGNTDPTTGLTNQADAPNLLVATTYGRGLFAIRLPGNQIPGPHVISFTPTNVTSSVSTVTVTFSGPVDPGTFTTSAITTFRGPNGPITPTAITDTNPGTDTIYQITFPTQATPGLYTMTFGPNLADFAGDLMDQNQNGINGEPLDTFTGHFVINSQTITPALVVGADAGGGPEVEVLNQATLAPIMAFFAYDPAFMGGVRVATGDVNGDGVPDIITGPGPSGGPDIRVFDGKTGALIREFMAFDPRFTGGVFVAAGDVNGDGFADIIVGADAGGGPEVRVFSGKDGTPLFSFFAYTEAFTGGVRVAAADVNGDGFADIITGAGPGGGPHVQVFSGKDLTVLQSFMAYDINFHGGVYVAAGDVRADAGDFNGDGRADIVTGAGSGGGPEVRIFSAIDGAALQSFFPYDPAFPGGVRVGVLGDVNGDGLAEVVTGAGPGGGPHVQALDGQTLSSLDSFFAFDPAFAGGVFVGGI